MPPPSLLPCGALRASPPLVRPPVFALDHPSPVPERARPFASYRERTTTIQHLPAPERLPPSGAAPYRPTLSNRSESLRQPPTPPPPLPSTVVPHFSPTLQHRPHFSLAERALNDRHTLPAWSDCITWPRPPLSLPLHSPRMGRDRHAAHIPTQSQRRP